ncbi:MAG TPA: adenylate cyclase regulatory domain-containing protein [Acidimicrobiales bacterium]|jgi:adenylate cyclase|nr:adenylate cyclase regulatory domain-containing protein [Acidimicrobiales bacterium]
MSDQEKALEDRMRSLLESLGVSAEEIDRASAEGHLYLLTVDRLLVAGVPRYTATEVAERSGMPVELTARFWRALGFTDVTDDERHFTDADVEALTIAQRFMDEGLADVEVALQMTRVIGLSMARVAEAEVTASPLTRNDLDPDEKADLFLRSLDVILPSIGRLLEYAWRRHLQAAFRRAMLAFSRGELSGATIEATVGFADLVGFTLLAQELSDEALAEVVSRFEALAFDTVGALGGQVVKVIGDEVMFVVRDPAEGARIALRLADAYADDELLSDVRVGLASGSVLAMEGDYYGPVVNLASRIVKIAIPGTVLVSDDVHAALRDDEELAFKPLRPRTLKDVGRVQLWALHWAGTEPPSDGRWSWSRRRGLPGVLPAAAELRARASELRDRATDRREERREERRDRDEREE